ncbi:MAG: phage tail protein [Kofleriaceae bacterium]
MAEPSGKTGKRNDPLPVFCFQVKIDGIGEAFFKSVTGLKYETESIPVREGGVNDTTWMLVGATKWSPLVFKKGFTKDSAAAKGLVKWRDNWTKNEFLRANGSITVLDTAFKEKVAWEFKRAWPTKWELSELDASKSELAIETLELTHEGLVLVG